MCSLGAAEIPAASCQEFINYKNRSSACVLCQRVASRSLTVCVYATADSAGVCCAWQGDKEVTLNSRACSFAAYVEISCLHHAREQPMSALRTVRSLPPYHVTCLLGVLAWTDQQSWWDSHFVSEAVDHHSANEISGNGDKTEPGWAMDLSVMTLGAAQLQKDCFPGFHRQKVVCKSQWLARCQPEQLHWMLRTDPVLHCTNTWHKVFCTSWLLWVIQIPTEM